METEHSRAQLYAGSAEEAELARRVEHAIDIENGIGYVGQDLADKLGNIAFDRIYPPGRQDDMVWVINEISSTFGTDNQIYKMLYKLHKEMSEIQADVDTSTQELIEEMGNL